MFAKFGRKTHKDKEKEVVRPNIATEKDEFVEQVVHRKCYNPIFCILLVLLARVAVHKLGLENTIWGVFS